jgi:hypothetical protein
MLIGDVLGSLTAKNIFVNLPESKKYEFVRSLHQQYSISPDHQAAVREALSQQFYAPYLLIQLIERDTFMRIEDFGPYERCLQEVSGAELTKLSENQRNEEMFMNFLRYVEMLGPSEPRKAKG